jgi:hypothetical protein
MPEPTHEDRAGERVFTETEEPKLTTRKGFRREFIRKSGDIQDGMSNGINIVEAGYVRPTGQHVEVPRSQYDRAPGPAAGMPDLLFSVVAATAAVGEMMARARERRRRRKEQDGHT